MLKLCASSLLSGKCSPWSDAIRVSKSSVQKKKISVLFVIVAKATCNNNLLRCIPKAACTQERFASIWSNPFAPAKSALLPWVSFTSKALRGNIRLICFTYIRRVQKISIVPAANIYRMFKPVATKRKVWYHKVKNYKSVTDTPFEPHRVYRYDRNDGKRSSCKAVEERFFRLAW